MAKELIQMIYTSYFSGMRKHQNSKLRRISVIAASFWCIFIVQSPAAAQQTGRIIGWGSWNIGVEPGGGFVAIAGGDLHGYGLKEDGSIVSLGGYGDLPSPNAGFIAIPKG